MGVNRLWAMLASLLVELHIIRNGARIGQRHRDEILKSSVALYNAAIAYDFMLMDDSYRTQRVTRVVNLLFVEGIIRQKWPTCSPKIYKLEFGAF